MQKIFTLTENHLKLVANLNFHFDVYHCAPSIDTKRPYGDSDIIESVVGIVGKEKATELNVGVHYALQIILQKRTFKLGKYTQIDSGEWLLVESYDPKDYRFFKTEYKEVGKEEKVFISRCPQNWSYAYAWQYIDEYLRMRYGRDVEMLNTASLENDTMHKHDYDFR